MIGPTLFIPDYVAIFAAVSAALSAVAYLWAPRKHLLGVSLIVYLSLAATASALLYDSGFVTSPFIALAILILVFSGVFGYLGLGIMAVAVNGYLAYELLVLQQELTNPGQIVIYLLAYETPLIVSWIIWHNKSNRANEQDRAYNELAQELSKVANKAEIVINAIGDGVIAVDNNGVIQLINPAAQQIIGWGKRDALGLDFKSVLKLEAANGDALTEITHPIEKTLRTNEPTRNNNLTLVTNSGKKIIVSVLTSAIGQPGSGAIVVFRDITKEKAEEREQFEFISTASHEMRTPVASIEGYLGLALNPNTAQIDDKARLYLTKAQESAQHLGRLFQDLLDVSRAEDGRLKSNPKVVDVVAFTQNIVSHFEMKAKEKGLILYFKPVDTSTTSDRKLSPVYYTEVDNDHLREVISNLIDNAIKYTPSGDVSVDVTGDTEHVTISISDTGIGIPPEDVSHLFQKFYRVDNTDTREIGGTGLGLYLSRRLVEEMGGRIWVESEYHKGSVFYVELPRISHEEATAKIERATERAIKTSTTPAMPAPATPAVEPPKPTPQPAPTPTPAPSAPVQTPAPAPVPPTVPAPAPIAPPTQIAVQQSPQPQPTPEQTQQSTPAPTVSSIPTNEQVDATAQLFPQATSVPSSAPTPPTSQQQPVQNTQVVQPQPSTTIRHSLTIPSRQQNQQK